MASLLKISRETVHTAGPRVPLFLVLRQELQQIGQTVGRNLGGTANTTQYTDAVIAAL